MAIHDWEKDLKEPISSDNWNASLMQGVQKRITLKKSIFKRFSPMAAVFISSVLILGVLFMNADYLRKWVAQEYMTQYSSHAGEKSQVEITEADKIAQVITEDQAIQIALKTDIGGSVDFPTTPGTKKVEATIGGKTGTTANLELTTKAEKKDNNTFVVTFVKDWHVKVGNKKAVSYWEYQVNSKGATLLKSEDNEKLIAIIK